MELDTSDYILLIVVGIPCLLFLISLVLYAIKIFSVLFKKENDKVVSDEILYKESPTKNIEKWMIRMFFVAISLMIYYKYMDSDIITGRAMYKAYYRMALRDPGSLEIYNEVYYHKDNEDCIVWEIDAGAKNSFGGFVRSRDRFVTYPNDVFIDNDGFRYTIYELSPYMSWYDSFLIKFSY